MFLVDIINRFFRFVFYITPSFTGVIAQQVKKVLPEITKPFYNDTYLSVVYTGLIPLLTEAIKELDEMYIDLISEAENMNAFHNSSSITDLTDMKYEDFYSEISVLLEEEAEIRNMHDNLLANVTILEDKVKDLRKHVCID